MNTLYKVALVIDIRGGIFFDDLFDSFQTKLNWMSHRNQKNILGNKKECS